MDRVGLLSRREGRKTRQTTVEAEGSGPLYLGSDPSAQLLSDYLVSSVTLTLSIRGLVIAVGANHAVPNVWFAVRTVLRFSAL